MQVLMIGDIVGRTGRRAVKINLDEIKYDFVVANGENAAGGNGITREIAQELFSCGVDVLTTGNHVWDKKEIFDFIDHEKRIVRPANYPPGTPGAGVCVYESRNKARIAVINLAGRVFMPGMDCPFRKADELIWKLKGEARIVLVDFHAEATSEKVAMAWYLAGRVSAVCGTHTHVQTADEQLLPGGTAYITDIGMTGPKNSIIGVKKEMIIEKFLTQLPKRFEVAGGSFQFNAVVIDIDEETGESTGIKRIQNFE